MFIQSNFNYIDVYQFVSIFKLFQYSISNCDNICSYAPTRLMWKVHFDSKSLITKICMIHIFNSTATNSNFLLLYIYMESSQGGNWIHAIWFTYKNDHVRCLVYMDNNMLVVKMTSFYKMCFFEARCCASANRPIKFWNANWFSLILLFVMIFRSISGDVCY